MAVGTEVEPAEAGKVVVSAVGVCAATVAAATKTAMRDLVSIVKDWLDSDDGRFAKYAEGIVA